MRHSLLLSAAVLLAACSGETPDQPHSSPAGEQLQTAEVPTTNAVAQSEQSPGPSSPQKDLIGEEVALAEWRKAENRADCAPLALRSGAGGDGRVRRANFSGGWGVAFDRPELRSAYGFAGAGSLPEDDAPHSDRVGALEEQWPHLHRYGQGENLPAGSVAGYGVIGAEPYPAGNPGGRGLHSLAYLRIPGQSCLYNVWSRLGRAHLEALLASLEIVGSDTST